MSNQVTAQKKTRFTDNNDGAAIKPLLNHSDEASKKQDVKRIKSVLVESTGSEFIKKRDVPWKPAINVSYETLMITDTAHNQSLRPAGFRPDGKPRQIKNTSMMSKIRTRCAIRKENPKVAVCITMYNEAFEELQATMQGVLHNYNCLKIDPKTNFTKDDFLVVVIVDGYENIPGSFKEVARDKGFLDEEVLFQKGFMDVDRDGNFKMKNMRDVMNEGVPSEKIPTNILHVF